jgi:hypothetical protein
LFEQLFPNYCDLVWTCFVTIFLPFLKRYFQTLFISQHTCFSAYKEHRQISRYTWTFIAKYARWRHSAARLFVVTIRLHDLKSRRWLTRDSNVFIDNTDIMWFSAKVSLQNGNHLVWITWQNHTITFTNDDLCYSYKTIIFKLFLPTLFLYV